MKYKGIFIEKKEYVYLKRLLNINEFSADFQIRKLTEQFQFMIQTAFVVDARELPDDVVRFNSMVELQFNNLEIRRIQLVIPNEENVNEHKISILSPLGVMILGTATGDVIKGHYLSEKEHARIVSVTQDVKQIIQNILI